MQRLMNIEWSEGFSKFKTSLGDRDDLRLLCLAAAAKFYILSPKKTLFTSD